MCHLHSCQFQSVNQEENTKIVFEVHVYKALPRAMLWKHLHFPQGMLSCSFSPFSQQFSEIYFLQMQAWKVHCDKLFQPPCVTHLSNNCGKPIRIARMVTGHPFVPRGGYLPLGRWQEDSWWHTQVVLPPQLSTFASILGIAPNLNSNSFTLRGNLSNIPILPSVQAAQVFATAHYNF